MSEASAEASVTAALLGLSCNESKRTAGRQNLDTSKADHVQADQQKRVATGDDQNGCAIAVRLPRAHGPGTGVGVPGARRWQAGR